MKTLPRLNALAPESTLVSKTTLVPKLQLGNGLCQAPAWRAGSCAALNHAKLELQGAAFPSWSLGTRVSRSLGTRASVSLKTRRSGP